MGVYWFSVKLAEHLMLNQFNSTLENKKRGSLLADEINLQYKIFSHYA
jgi:hypothetical protein